MSETASQLDYYNTLLAGKAGKRVFLDVKKMLITWFRQEGQAPLTAEEALAQCTLDNVVMMLEAKCGIDNEMAEKMMIDSMAAVSDAMLKIENKKPEKPDLHNID